MSSDFEGEEEDFDEFSSGEEDSLGMDEDTGISAMFNGISMAKALLADQAGTLLKSIDDSNSGM